MKRMISMAAIFCMVVAMFSCYILPVAAFNSDAAVSEMGGLITYFERSLAEKDAALSEALNKAEQIVASASFFEEAEIEECLAALKTFRNQAPYLPRVTQVDQYPDESGYMIMDTSDLLYIANNATNTAKFKLSQTIYLGDDLDLSGVAFWPIPKASFSFDGMGHTIKNWSGKSRYDYQAFFQEYMGQSIKNVTFEDFDLESGYSRAALISELKSPDTLLIENVHMENVKINAINGSNSNQNRMGLYISRNTSTSPPCDITIRNCQIKNCKLTNDNGPASVNESGLIAGYIRNNGDLKLENILVLNSSSEVETGDGGLLLGNLENFGEVSFKNVAVIGGAISGGADTGTVGIMVGIHTCANAPAFENCLVYGVSSEKAQIWARGWNDRNMGDENEVTATGVTATNCVIDILNPYVGIAKTTGQTGDAANFGYIQGLQEVQSLAEAVWSVNHGSASPIYYLSAVENDLSAEEKDGYYLPKKVTFISGIGEDAKEVAAFYTNADGKLPATASLVLEDILYTWKLGEESVSIDRIYAEDAVVISTVVHSFEMGEAVSDVNGTHKVYCTEEGCQAYIIEACAHSRYQQNADETHSSICRCSRLLATENCRMEYTFDGGISHSGLCAQCLRTVEAEECRMSEYEILPGDEPTTTAPGKETSSCALCDHKEYKILKQIAKGKLILSGDGIAKTGEPYELDLKLSGNGAPGISAIGVTITYDPEKFTLSEASLPEQSQFIGGIDTNESGKIKIGLMASTPVSADATLAMMDFLAEEEAGQAEFEILVHEAILSGTAMDDATFQDLQLEAEGKQVRVIDQITGDVNMDRKVTIADAVLLLRVVNGKLNSELVNIDSADVDGVDGITTADVLRILQYVIGKIEKL